MRRTIIILVICILALVTMAASCDPDPNGWTGNDDPFAGVRATMTYGAEEFHAQLTALAETEEPTP